MLALCEALCDKYTIATISAHVLTFYFQIHQYIPKKVITMNNLKEQKVGGGLETRQTWTH
jgi:hypothetical protein